MEATREAGFEQAPPAAPDHDAMVAAGAEFKLTPPAAAVAEYYDGHRHYADAPEKDFYDCYYRRATEEELADTFVKSVAGKPVYIKVRETLLSAALRCRHHSVAFCTCRWTRKATLRWTFICVRSRSAFKKETPPKRIPLMCSGSSAPSLGGT